jgi:ubiquinone/menaquinone biosynthesis C-methylase UbiE
MRVLEIGCGDGRLSRLIAPETGRLIGSDVTLSKLKAAHNQGIVTPAAPVCFTAAQAETMPFFTEAFDLAFFSWSL